MLNQSLIKVKFLLNFCNISSFPFFNNKFFVLLINLNFFKIIKYIILEMYKYLMKSFIYLRKELITKSIIFINIHMNLL